MPSTSHPEHPKPCLATFDTSTESSFQALRQHGPRMCRGDNPIIPQPRGRVHRIALPFDPRLQLGINRLPHRLHHRPELLRAHNPDLRLRPHPQEPRAVRSPTHAVVARAGTGPDHDGEFGYVGTGYSRDKFGAVFGDAAFFGVGADHEAADVLEEDEGDAALGAELDEVGAFEGGGGEEDAVVGEDTDWVGVDAGEAW